MEQLLYCRNGHLWDSTDGGTNWKKLSAIVPGSGVMAATFLAGSRTTLVAAVADKGLYRTTNAGKTWTAVTSGLPHLVVTDVVANPSVANTLWAITRTHRPRGCMSTNSKEASHF